MCLPQRMALNLSMFVGQALQRFIEPKCSFGFYKKVLLATYGKDAAEGDPTIIGVVIFALPLNDRRFKRFILYRASQMS